MDLGSCIRLVIRQSPGNSLLDVQEQECLALAASLGWQVRDGLIFRDEALAPDTGNMPV